MDAVLRETDRLRAQVEELQTCLGNGDRVIDGLQSSRVEAERWGQAARKPVSLDLHHCVATLVHSLTEASGIATAASHARELSMSQRLDNSLYRHRMMRQHPRAFETPVGFVPRPDMLLRREAAAAAEAASALQQHLEQAQQELSRLAAEREELLLECDNLRTAVSFTGESS